jgi:hypothetical protein
MRTAKTYDTPILAMIEAFNAHAGGEITMPELRDEWWFRLDDADKENKFGYWLDKTLELPAVAEMVTVVYKRQPGWYTEVRFAVAKEIVLV